MRLFDVATAEEKLSTILLQKRSKSKDQLLDTYHIAPSHWRRGKFRKIIFLQKDVRDASLGGPSLTPSVAQRKGE